MDVILDMEKYTETLKMLLGDNEKNVGFAEVRGAYIKGVMNALKFALEKTKCEAVRNPEITCSSSIIDLKCELIEKIGDCERALMELC